MYSDLALYYLNQIGIQPWISKEHASALVPVNQLAALKTPKLFILTPMLHGKAELLLRKMIHCIGLNDEHWETIQPQDLSRHWLDETKPSALLSLGVVMPEFIADTPINCPVIPSLSLEHLINRPSDKKQVLKDLYSLKHHLSSNTDINL